MSVAVMMMALMTPTLVLLHGFTNTGGSWDPVIAALGERYRALAPDIRGHGSASARQPATLEVVTSDVAELATGRFTLGGYSMGGRIALHVALALPDRLERLVLISASPGIADAAERAARMEADERLAIEIESSTVEEFARRWALNAVLADQPEQVRAGVHWDRLQNSSAGMARALRGLGTGTLEPVWDRLERLSMPVLLIVGERDQKCRETAERMARRIERSEIAVVPGAGHAAHLEAPQFVADAIESWAFRE